MLRDAIEYTSRIDLKKGVAYDHTVPIVQRPDPAIAATLIKSVD